jgi:hypothetical protein
VTRFGGTAAGPADASVPALASTSTARAGSSRTQLESHLSEPFGTTSGG